MAESKADTSLLAQMEQAEHRNENLLAWFTLQTEPDVPSPERTLEIVHSLVRRVTSVVGKPVERLRIFEQLGSFGVQAPAALLRLLLSQPEIASARAASLSGPKLVHPVPSRPSVMPRASRTPPPRKRLRS